MNRYRLEILYASGRVEHASAQDMRVAEKLRDKYRALPTVQSVLIIENKRGR